MLVASHWQYRRYQAKKIYISKMQDNLKQAPTSLLELSSSNPEAILYRRVNVSGTYDFSREIILRNRRYHEMPGSFVLTPLKLADSENYLLVSRGFIPLNKSAPEQRKEFAESESVKFMGLIKPAMKRKLFAPKDPPSGPGQPWVDQWLRVDLENISKQLPYPILPFYVELMGDSEEAVEKMEAQIVNSKSEKSELLFMPARSMHAKEQLKSQANLKFPVPVYDTVIPPGRHFGYIFEWAIMAFVTLLIGVVLQLRPLKRS